MINHDPTFNNLTNTGQRERVEVTAKDVRGNTALHYAAANGLRRCVEYLVAHGAEVFLDNYDGLTVSLLFRSYLSKCVLLGFFHF